MTLSLKLELYISSVKILRIQTNLTTGLSAGCCGTSFLPLAPVLELIDPRHVFRYRDYRNKTQRSKDDGGPTNDSDNDSGMSSPKEGRSPSKDGAGSSVASSTGSGE